MIPTLVVGSPASGQGKTSVVCALACALQARGVDVRLFKAGPDYLDPSFHHAALGRPSRNLDAWMTGEAGLLDSFARGCEGLKRPGLALVEGMMGLFDGRAPDSLAGSSAEVAERLGAPAVLVMDASGAARSAVATVEGFANHSARVRVGGVLFNRVGSVGHGRLLAAAMEQAQTRHPVRVLGSLPETPDLHLPSRHLGLLAAHVSEATATEPARARWRAALSAWVEAHVDLDALLELAQEARPPEAPRPPRPPVAQVRVGLALDEAFHFYYPDNIDLLREAGAEIVPLSPLHDAALPEGLDGLIIGGGYPEEHAEALAANDRMRASVRAFSASGRPVLGECGGLMYLGESLVDAAGRAHAMCGALPLSTRMRSTLTTLGYRELTTTRDSVLGPAGLTLRGHAFHYSELAEVGDCPLAWRWTGWRAEGEGGFLRGNTLASYVHAHWGSNPEVPRAFVRACAEARP